MAAGAATLGAKVALIEKRALGGDCLYYGCVPSKSLLHAAGIAHTMRRAPHYGIGGSAPAVAIGDVMRRVQGVIATLRVNDSPERFRAMGVQVMFGDGRFTGHACFQVNGRDVTAKSFVIATGSRAVIPALAGLDTVPYLTNENVFSLDEPVPELIVLGAGPAGMEMAQSFARLGSRVQVVQDVDRVLPRDDPDLTAVVMQQLTEEGVRFHLHSTAVRVSGGAGDIKVTVKNDRGETRVVEGSHLFIAVGRRANLESLGLDSAGVDLDDTGHHVATDARLRTSNRSIYACGDTVGPYMFTHMAEHHGGVILRNALFRLPARVEKRAVPWCTFTDPELARVGMSETEARRQGRAYRVYTFAFHNVDRAQVQGETAGFAKIVTAPRGRLLGAALVGPRAGELIHEYALAVARGMTAADLSQVIHIYPTLAQINRKVADERLKQNLTPARKKWIKRLLRLRGV